MIKTSTAVALFLLRHFIAVGFAICVAALLTLIGYGMLLLFAVVTETGSGSPLALPAWFIFVVLGGLSVGWGLFVPACAVGRLAVALAGWPKLAAIPIVAVTCAGLLCLWVALFGGTPGAVPPLLWLALAGALGAYWWLTEGFPAFWDLLLRWWRARRAKAKLKPQP